MSEMNDNTGKLLALEVLLRQATERNGNLSVELAAMKNDRDALRRENEQLRRELAVLVDALIKKHPCSIYNEHPTPLCRGEDIFPDVCRMCVVEWAKQQAAQAGKEGEM